MNIRKIIATASTLPLVFLGSAASAGSWSGNNLILGDDYYKPYGSHYRNNNNNRYYNNLNNNHRYNRNFNKNSSVIIDNGNVNVSRSSSFGGTVSTYDPQSSVFWVNDGNGGLIRVITDDTTRYDGLNNNFYDHNSFYADGLIGRHVNFDGWRQHDGYRAVSIW